MKEPARLAAPSATSSRLGLMEYPKRAAFCFAATMLSRKPTTAINLYISMLEKAEAYSEDMLTQPLRLYGAGI